MKRLLVAVLVAAAFVAAAVVIRSVTVDDNGSSSRVPVVGDSITFVSAHEIATALEGRYQPDLHAAIGERIDQMLPALRTALRADPFAVVVNLGTNDALQARTHPDWQRGFTSMVAALAPVRCVVLTTISSLVDGPSASAVASEINRAISEAVSAHPNFHVVDWNAAVHRPSGPSLLDAGRIHPSPAGQVVLAGLLRTALDHDCRNT